jgi:hypothetical protein
MDPPNNVLGWASLLATFLAGFGWIIKMTIGRSFNELSESIRKLTRQLESQDHRLDDHEVKLAQHDEKIRTLFNERKKD